MTKAAILIDGGYFLARLPSVRKTVDPNDPAQVADAIEHLVRSHLRQLNKVARQPHDFALLYRCFYYDAIPYDRKAHLPVSGRGIDYARSAQAIFRRELFEALRRKRNFAIRLGSVMRERSWVMDENVQKDLIAGKIGVDDLTDDHFYAGLRQKGVDMRIGLDIASLTLKKQVDTIILVAGDSDFVPAAKLARREGVQIILDPLWRSVTPDLFEHIDYLRSGVPRPGARAEGFNEDDEGEDVDGA
ncbi:NYN domain-containing protein [Minwuia thermotolerans]|uniref:NYN domain-containing protein n=1 Tax=Minwuia thermotolerans TaxID=2056226 RepID=A0A2M9FY06_9PROT|nr:NYN domain-containing protein [Minwuia thermotolerans]PJK28319.1 hypothetical protein CVT23_18285 [Minwuia thermotolerans]